ncbi:hexokinase A [Ancistrocladus abbreviatus]
MFSLVFHEGEKVPENEITLEKKKLVVKACDIITRRGARLAAAGIFAILTKLGRDTITNMKEQKKTVIAIDGSLYFKYAKFRGYLVEALRELLPDDVFPSVDLQQARDGSGIGAAIIAASYSNENN